MDPHEPGPDPLRSPGARDEVPAVSAEELVDGQLAEDAVVEPTAEPRRYPSTIGGAFYLGVLAVCVGALVVTALADWRTGIQLWGAALLFAAAVRLVLSDSDAGMLGVRHKAIDATLLISVGIVMIVLARTIPNQPG